MNGSVVIAAGGTGGHLVPGLAVADALRSRTPDLRVVFVGARRGIGAEAVARAGYDARTTTVRPLSRSARGLLGPPSLVPAVIQARRILREVGARAVVGMGGYPSLPVVLGARLTRVPALIHEANAIAGLANQVAARVTPHIAVAFDGAATGFRRPVRCVGMPLRASIARLDRDAARREGYHAFGLDPGRRTVVVTGGSQGAASIGRATVAVARAWRERDDVQVLLAAGADKADGLRTQLGSGDGIRIEPTIDRMDLAYGIADVVVARAGASTVFELAAAGVAAVLVPFPHARRGEQHANARLLAGVGAAVVLDDAELDARLRPTVEALLADDDRRAAMASAARSVAQPGAADALATWALSLAGIDDA